MQRSQQGTTKPQVAGQSPPSWLKRGVFITYPKLNIVFEPLRLRFLPDKRELIVFYTGNRAVYVNKCRLAEPADLFNERIDLYISGQRYASHVEGQRIRLSSGARQYLIQLESDANVFSFAHAFDGQVVDLSDEHNQWLDKIFKPKNQQ